MAKSKGDALLAMVAVAVFAIAYPLVWLHERIGTTGLLVMVGLVCGGLFYKYKSFARKTQGDLFRRFEFDAVHAMKGLHARPDYAATIKDRYRSSPQFMIFIRHLQIFGESAKIALESAKPETAKDRFKTALDAYREAIRSKSEYPSSVIWEELEKQKRRLVENFPCAWRTNAATALLKQAEGLKTDVAKRKRWLQVVELLSDPQATPTPQMLGLLASTRALLASDQETDEA
jgi:hypothetical protein